MYSQKKTNMDETLAEFNKQRTNIKFSIKKEKHNSINFLGLTIHRNRTKLEFTIYRKPTQMDILILNDSCHPYEYKISSVYCLTDRMLTYPITK
jgi:hypothetical protein